MNLIFSHLRVLTTHINLNLIFLQIQLSSVINNQKIWSQVTLSLIFSNNHQKKILKYRVEIRIQGQQQARGKFGFWEILLVWSQKMNSFSNGQWITLQLKNQTKKASQQLDQLQTIAKSADKISKITQSIFSMLIIKINAKKLVRLRKISNNSSYILNTMRNDLKLRNIFEIQALTSKITNVLLKLEQFLMKEHKLLFHFGQSNSQLKIIDLKQKKTQKDLTNRYLNKNQLKNKQDQKNLTFYYFLDNFQSLIFCSYEFHISLCKLIYDIIIKASTLRKNNMSRYQTLNVSLQTDNHKNQSRLSQTLDYSPDQQQGQTQNNNNQSDQRVRKFRQLYYKNEKLRRQLKLLNAKLNEKLEKVKFPSVSVNGKKRAASVDLDRQPPNKALQRELQNGYKQIKMYKQQIQLLKIKQQSSQNYAKLRDMQNSISYKDKQIAEVLQQLKSIKSIKMMQQKKIVSQLQNQDVKQRIQSYERQHKELKDKLKQITIKSRRRDQQYKKQQAYLVSLSKKYRIANNQHNQQHLQAKNEKIQRPNKQISDNQFAQVKLQIEKQKKYNDQVLKKGEILRKQLKLIRDQNQHTQQKYKEKDALAKTLQTKIISLNRLLRQQQRKPKQNPKNPLITNIEDLSPRNDKNPKNLADSFSQVEEDPKQHTINISKQDQSLKKMLKQMESSGLHQREWKGKYRKVQHGFGAPGDKKFQFQGNLIGLQISLDENQAICGVVFIFQDSSKSGIRQQPIQGKRSNVQLKWEIKPSDKISKISGSFSQQSYLTQLILISKSGASGVFGTTSSQPFTFRLTDQQRISGCFGSVRELGSDRRITQLGFWIEKI